MLNAITMRQSLDGYLESLRRDEKAPGTIGKYRRDIGKFFCFLDAQEGAQEVSKEQVLRYKDGLTKKYKISSVNSYIIALNRYLSWLGEPQLRAVVVRQQQKSSLEDVLSRTDYERLLRFAKRLGKEKLYYVMRTLAGTGIRIEELRYITVEAVTRAKGCVEVQNKGKLRTIVISPELCRELRLYCRRQGIVSGIIFHNRSGDGLIDKAYLWREMKKIAGRARVSKKKVHAHSFRHLFAKTFLAANGDIVELADILGHSSLETTRIYTRSSAREKRDKVAKLGL